MKEKYCVDCKYHRTAINNTHLCSHPYLGKSLVTGEQLEGPCDIARRHSAPCGINGKLFVAQSEA